MNQGKYTAKRARLCLWNSPPKILVWMLASNLLDTVERISHVRCYSIPVFFCKLEMLESKKPPILPVLKKEFFWFDSTIYKNESLLTVEYFACICNIVREMINYLWNSKMQNGCHQFEFIYANTSEFIMQIIASKHVCTDLAILDI